LAVNGIHPVVSAVKLGLVHAPGLVRYGSKPYREISKSPELLDEISSHLRGYQDAVAYPPNRVFLGDISPDDLKGIERPWFQVKEDAPRLQRDGDILQEEEFYGMMKALDQFDLVWLEESFMSEVKSLLAKNPFVTPKDVEKLGDGKPASDIEAQSVDSAFPLHTRDGRLIGCFNRAHHEDLSLTAHILLENLVCKTTGVMALRTMLAQDGIAPDSVDYVINSGEEAVGDRYQRGGGNLGKAMAEDAGCVNATGSDVKAFCCAPNHAMMVGASLVQAGVYKRVVVMGGASLAKLGMKFQGHLKNDMPIIEDVLAGFAIVIEPDDGKSPVLRLDSIGSHTVGAASSQQAIFEKLIVDPLAKLGLRFEDIDKYATELHNPEVTEPSGNGDVPERNYRLIASLAAYRKEIGVKEIGQFIEKHGMPGYSPTQGHVASAVPFLGHALVGLQDGSLNRVMFLAKGSLFLGRMTQQSDGLSFILERNPAL
jgi:betaine reductase